MSVLTTGIINGFRVLQDRTVRLTFDLQEITDPVKLAEIVSLNGKFSKVLISDENIIKEVSDVVEALEVEEEGRKSESQRLRAVLYRLWEQDNDGIEDFSLFYRSRMDRLIDQINLKIRNDASIDIIKKWGASKKPIPTFYCARETSILSMKKCNEQCNHCKIAIKYKDD